MSNALNPVGWFEIAVSDMDRAIRFYSAVFGYSMERHKMDVIDMAWFPMHPESPGAMGALVCNREFYRPSVDGALVYFNVPSGDLSNELGKVEKAGGKVLIPKTLISEQYGHMAVCLDTEGNRIALHSMQ